ncbi:MAG: glycosyltransferase [Saprospiraceae bacterium]|nr:glycosyltransferase [Saprospiraceae bacterium]
MNVTSNGKIEIVFLYAELQAYNMAVIRSLINNWNARVTVVRWTNHLKMEFHPPSIEHLEVYSRSDFNSDTLYKKLLELPATIIFTSGWMDPMYTKVCKKWRKNFDLPVVSLSDTQWHGSWKQWIARLIFKYTHKTAFSHIAVAGPRQKKYAQILGFFSDEILEGCYSADLELFNEYFEKSHPVKNKKYPHRFLYLGRFAPEKGIKMMLQAWNEIENKKDWNLTIVGKGPLVIESIAKNNLHVDGFRTQNELLEIITTSGFLLVPSLFEPWSVTIHEFAAAGLPILSSDACGANDIFVEHGENGYIFPTANITSLKSYMVKIMDLSDAELIQFAERSHALGQRINPDMIATEWMSVLASS